MAETRRLSLILPSRNARAVMVYDFAAGFSTTASIVFRPPLMDYEAVSFDKKRNGHLHYFRKQRWRLLWKVSFGNALSMPVRLKDKTRSGTCSEQYISLGLYGENFVQPVACFELPATGFTKRLNQKSCMQHI